MKRLLAISWEMPPLSGPRAVQVTRTLSALADRGWHSRVVCFDARSRRYQQDFDVAVEHDTSEMVQRLPVPSPEEWLFFRALWHVLPPLKHLPDEKRVWVPSAIAEGRRVLAEHATDVIVSFGQPWSDHLVGLQLHRDSGVPFVAHFSDPWVDSPYQTGNSWTRARIAAMERDVIAAAARVVFVNRYTRDRVMGKYAADWMKKTHVVPQGHVGVSSSRERNRSGAPMRIVYTGRFYDGIRTPETFLRAMASVHKDSPLDRRVVVEFVGSRMEPYQQLAVTLGIDALVRFSGRVSPDQARARAAAADVLLMIDAHSDGDSLFLPSKLIDYLPLGAPILAVTPAVGPSADLVRELGYLVVDPGDVHGIANAIKQLLASYEASSLTPSARHESVAEAYHIRATTMAFEAVLDAAVATP